MKTVAAVAVALGLVASGAGAQTSVPRARLQGTFTMTGKVTTAVHVYGEHVGQRVHRMWTFVPMPQCKVGACRRVILNRQRSGQHITDTLTLTRQPSGLYVGHGRFFVALRCAGQVVAHGGVAGERITVRIVRTTTVGTTTFASAIRASYRNPWRRNLTRCPGGIGHDAARYRGHLVSGAP